MIAPLAEIAKIFKPLFHDTMNIMHAFDHGHRYWIDYRKQPHRMPGKKPLIHNGKKPIK